MSTNSILYAYRDGAPQSECGSPVVNRQRAEEEKTDKALFCKECANQITRHEHSIEVNGSHTHAFFNPAGIIFELGCFSIAPGCCLAGKATPEFTWFAGHVWCFAMCKSCGSHLGWYYERGDSAFYGLILTRLSQ